MDSTGCDFQFGTIECRGDGYCWDADYDGYDPNDHSRPCPQCNTKEWLIQQKEAAETTISFSGVDSGTGVDIWESAVSVAYRENPDGTEAILAEIGIVDALTEDEHGKTKVRRFTYSADTEGATNTDLVRRSDKPGYAQIWIHNNRPVLIMGNSIEEQKDGTHYVWAADLITGERDDASITELKPFEGQKLSLLEVVYLVEAWAKDGNGDAMWWLGHFYEFGCPSLGVNGGKSLAYYLGAIRCEPERYDKGTVDRVLLDGCNLFRARHAEAIQDKTPVNTSEFLAKFHEYREYEVNRRIYHPGRSDWAACVAIAESLP